NNEIGNLNDIEAIAILCRETGAVYHTDTVQSMGKYRHDLQSLKVDFLVGSAHKFHGPKGIGFMYIDHSNKIRPLIPGGSQERNMRGGTENVAGIVGLAKALEIAYRDMEPNRQRITALKARMVHQLREHVEDVSFNGLSGDLEASLYSVINVSVPE